MMPSSSRMLCSSSTTRTRVSGIGGRKVDGERGPGPAHAVDFDLAAMLLHDPVDEREADAAAVALRGEERLEDVADIVEGDPFAGIADGELQPPTMLGGTDAQLAAVGHRLRRVQAEIPDRLAELLRIDAPCQRSREFADDLQRAGGGAVLQQQQDLVEAFGDVDALAGQWRRTRIPEEFLDDAVEASRFLQDDL